MLSSPAGHLPAFLLSSDAFLLAYPDFHTIALLNIDYDFLEPDVYSQFKSCFRARLEDTCRLLSATKIQQKGILIFSLDYQNQRLRCLN